MRRLTFALFLFALVPLAHGLEIRIDYSYDTSNFFDTEEKRNAIESVARFYGDMIEDNLLAIDNAEFSSSSWQAIFRDPSTGTQTSITNLVVPEDVIIIFVGARELGGSTLGIAGPGGFSASGFSDWFDRIRGRGNSGAATDNEADRTDFALWGGSIAFDSPRIWNFSLSENSNGAEFLRVALHEMAHVLGIGTAATWDNQLSSGTYTGATSVQSYGTAPPADSGHFQNSINSEQFGSFSAAHGAVRPALMLPSSTDTGSNFDVATDLDLAALVDIGWQLDPETNFVADALSPSAVTLSWQSVSFKTYTVERSIDLASFPDSSSSGPGDGTVQSYTDPSPPAEKAFYRLLSSSPAQISQAGGLDTKTPETESAEYGTIYVAPKQVENCVFE
jgi:hypothetical protein